MKKWYDDKIWLQEQIDEERSVRDIAEELGVSYMTIYRQLKLFNIPLRSQKESVSKPSKKPGKKTQTTQEYVDKLAKMDKLIAEVKEDRELIKALKGEPSNYYVSESEAEHNRQVAHGKARRERYRQMEEDLAFEKRKSGGGATHCGSPEEDLAGIMYRLGEYI